MNYHHAYHAGHSADIFKHVILFELLQILVKKEKPLSYIETHAAFPYYDLQSNLPQTTHAYKHGFDLLKKASLSNPLQEFMQIILKLNHHMKSATLQFYPGSAWIAHQLLRKDDVMYLADINVDAIKQLKSHLKNSSKIHLSNEDGFAMLNAWIPPTPARGLLFIDPPYEHENEWKLIVNTCKKMVARWSHGIYLIWYPIKALYQVKKFYDHLSCFQKKMIIEFCTLGTDIAQRLNGSGLIIINPPWQFKETIEPLLKELLSILKIEKKAYYKIIS